MFEPQHLAQQRAFAAARATHQRQYLAAMHAQIQIAMHHLQAELRPQIADFDDAVGRITHRHTPTLENRIAKIASTMITMVIAATTELVVPMPRLSVLG